MGGMEDPFSRGSRIPESDIGARGCQSFAFSPYAPSVDATIQGELPAAATEMQKEEAEAEAAALGAKAAAESCVVQEAAQGVSAVAAASPSPSNADYVKSFPDKEGLDAAVACASAGKKAVASAAAAPEKEAAPCADAAADAQAARDGCVSCPEGTRVKLYEVDAETGNWIDRGTGHFFVVDGAVPDIPERDSVASAAAAEGSSRVQGDDGLGSRLMVQEEENELLVVDSVICGNTLYQHQKESIITWQEGRQGDYYRALSFQHPHGCFALWTYIYLLSPDACAGSMSDEEDDEEMDSEGSAVTASGRADSSSSSLGGGVSEGGLWLRDEEGERPTRVLGIPCVASLSLLAQRIDYDLQHPQRNREALQDIRNRTWLRGLFRLMRDLMQTRAEGEGEGTPQTPSLGTCISQEAAAESLQQMALIIRKMLVAWTGQLDALEVFLSDEFWIDVLHCLEHERELASQGMALPHTAFFKRVQFHEVLSPQQQQQHELFLQHVHLHYRLMYLRDVALTRYIDEASIAQLQSLLASNGHTIISLLSQVSPLPSPTLKNSFPSCSDSPLGTQGCSALPATGRLEGKASGGLGSRSTGSVFKSKTQG
ncbi:hypothetical protein cyc_03411 [Cyclospora cayetanensis]|uniref:Uncharacterized protein n=1 Tax=Cyclospora cayetanensis TaxID=88456 RepID=A0A1D3CWD4_9EIME|nr:hypothetical protein cyc_03411 [Cyclospora cayetanensis]